MSEQVELWPKPIMYGAGFKITYPTNCYEAFQLYLDNLMMAMMPIKYEKEEEK